MLASLQDDSGSMTSASTTDTTSRSGSPTAVRARRRGRRSMRKSKTPKTVKAPFKFTTYLREDHGLQIFGTQFNHYVKRDQPLLFATVGSNRVSIYECLRDGGVKLLQCYSDPDVSLVNVQCTVSY